MASSQQNVDFVLEQLAAGGADGVSARKMFGEYGIYRHGKIVALFCDDQLFVKPTVGGRAFIGKVTEAPPYPGAKFWFLITGDHCEDGEWLSELVRITERELPPPKAKSPKAKSLKTGAQVSKTKAKTKVTSALSKPSKTKAKAKTNSRTKSAKAESKTTKRKNPKR